MELLTYSQKFTHSKITAEQALAEEVWLYFGKRLPFARVMRHIQLLGKIYIRETLEEIKKSDAKDHLALFIHRCKTDKVAFHKRERRG